MLGSGRQVGVDAGQDRVDAGAFAGQRQDQLALGNDAAPGEFDLGSLQRELGDLDRIGGWVRVFGMVNSTPGFDRHPAVINGFSDLILAVFGLETGRQARSAIGVAGLPFDIAVEIEAEVVLVR